MPRIALAMLAGMLLMSRAPALPPPMLLPAAAAACVVLLIVRPLRLVALGLAAACWFALNAAWVLADRLHDADDRRSAAGRFCLEDFPRASGRALVFPASTADPSLPARVRLHWYEAPVAPRIGECWQLEVLLRAPRGLANPGGFDYEKWLFTQGIGATGYVRGSGGRVADPAIWQPAAWRSALERRLLAALPEDTATAVLVALVTGSRHRLDAASRERFILTGTSHLMAISGLHVGLVAGLVFVCCRRCAMPGGRDAAAMLAFLAALAYGLVAGFGVPVRRALLMLAAMLLAERWRRPRAPVPGLCLALIVVLIVQPLDLLTPGFALSFAAVAAILAILSSPRPAARTGGGLLPVAAAAFALQWRLWLLLLPLTLVLFDRVAWPAVPANLIAIPLFAFVVVPLALVGAFLSFLVDAPAALLLQLDHLVLSALLTLLGWLAALPGADWQPPGAGAAVAAGLLAAAACLLLPGRLPARAMGGWLVLPLILSRPAFAPPGCVLADVLDVGQGLAVLIRTRGRTLLYDAGPAYASGADAGARVVLPLLRRLGIARLDLMVISHADSDHAGGAPSVLAARPVGRVMSGEPGELPGLRAQACAGGQRWRWDDVEFRVLWPPAAGDAGNDQSCVIEIVLGDRRVLLTGDIEEAAERELIAAGLTRPADVVIVPHHGSATSSSAPFVRTLQPDLAVVSAAHNNRWGFPRAEVVARWREVGARVLVTGGQGALSLRLCADGRAADVSTRRASHRRIWTSPQRTGASGT